jgi:hypothetical protein
VLETFAAFKDAVAVTVALVRVEFAGRYASASSSQKGAKAS